jgi:hypothetical protein
MQTNTNNAQPVSEKITFISIFKEEIKIANLFRSASNLKELLNDLKVEMRDYFDAKAFTIYFADHKKNQIVSKIKAGLVMLLKPAQ